MAINITISKFRFPNNGTIDSPITVSLFYKEYYDTDFTLIGTGYNVDVNGNITDSPLPVISIDPTLKYVLKVINELCGYEYEQAFIFNPYCPVGYEASPDLTYCFYEEIISATPPTGTPATLIQKQGTSYSTCGSYIYNTGFNQNGTGTSTQIPIVNTFWRNGGTCIDNTLSDGPLNRCGIWATITMTNQDIGFSECIDIEETKTYYVGIACDNYGIIKLDGVTIIEQNVAALDIQYPGAGSNSSTFKVFHIYPIQITSGSHILEMIGHNTSGAAAFGAEIYDNTPAEIIAATSYAGLNIIFSTKDKFGQQVQLGTGNTGFSCPSGYSLQTCSSPYVCRRLVTTPILY